MCCQINFRPDFAKREKKLKFFYVGSRSGPPLRPGVWGKWCKIMQSGLLLAPNFSFEKQCFYVRPFLVFFSGAVPDFSNLSQHNLCPSGTSSGINLPDKLANRVTIHRSFKPFPLPTILNTFDNFQFGRIPLKDNMWSHALNFILGHLLFNLVITTNHFRCLKGDIPTTIQKVANIRLQKVLKPESEKRGKKSGYSVNEKKNGIQKRKSESGRIESGRKSGVRFVNGDYSRESNVTSMLKELKWPTLQQRRTNTKMVMMYRIVHHLVAIPSQMYLTPATTRTTRGHDQKFQIPFSRIQRSKLILPLSNPNME